MNLIRKQWPWLAIFALATGLRIANLGGESLWYDESFTRYVVRPDTDFWRAIRGDTHPPLWSMIQWINVRLLGEGEIAFRFPALLFSLAGFALLPLIARELGYKRPALLTVAALAAVHPAGLYFAQDGRQYAALSFFVLLALWGALRSNWIVFALGSIAACYTQNVGLLYTFALGLAVMFTKARAWRDLVRPGLALGATVAAWSPWALTMFKQAGAVNESFWMAPINIVTTVWPVVLNTVGWRMNEIFNIPIFAGAITLTITSLMNGRRLWITRKGMLVLAVAFGGPILLALISALWRNIYVYRAMLPSGALLLLLWGYALNNLETKKRRIVRAAIVPALLIAVIAHYYPNGNGREVIPEFVAPVLTQYQPGDDVVFHTQTNTAISYDLYLNMPTYIRPHPGEIIGTSQECREAFGLKFTDFDNLYQMGYRRAWLFFAQSPFNTADELAELQRIFATYPHQLIRTSPGVTVHVEIWLIEL